VLFKWRLYLEDGSSFDSNDGDAQDSPVFPRTVIVAQPGVRERTGFSDIIVGVSYYTRRTDLDCWLGFEQDIFIHHEWMLNAHLIDAFRVGALMDERLYRELWKQARSDLGMK